MRRMGQMGGEDEWPMMLLSQFDDAALDWRGDGLRAIGRLQFAENALEMVLDSVKTAADKSCAAGSESPGRAKQRC
jgi:hypothetical protein